MLTTDGEFKLIRLGAYEPLCLDFVVQDKNGAALDISSRQFALAVYAPNRDLKHLFTPEVVSDNGTTVIRYQEDGEFSEALYGQGGLKVEFSERLQNAKSVFATAMLSIEATSEDIPSYDNGARADYATRVYINVADDGVKTISTERKAYVDLSGGQVPEPAPVIGNVVIQSDGTPQVGEQLTGVDPAVNNGSISTRRWLFGGAPVGNGNTFTPTQEGVHSWEVGASGPGGDAVKSASVSVQAATPTPTPAPAFTTQPSVSPTSGTAGTTTFTATPGTVSNGAITSRAWLLNGTSISSGLTAAPQAAGTLTYQEFATGAGGSTQSAVQSVTVAAAPAPTPTPTPTPVPTPIPEPTPVPQTIAGLMAAYDADRPETITYAYGAVSRWANPYGPTNVGTQTVAGNMPTSGFRRMNGRNVLYYGNAGVAGTSGSLGDQITVNLPFESGYTIACVFRYEGASTDRFIFNGANGSLSLRFTAAGQVQVLRQGQATLVQSNMRFARGETYLVVVKGGAFGTSLSVTGYDSTTSTVRDDTVTSATSAALTAPITSIGGFSSSSGKIQFTGDFATFLAYSGSLADADVASLKSYLTARWLTPASLPASPINTDTLEVFTWANGEPLAWAA